MIFLPLIYDLDILDHLLSAVQMHMQRLGGVYIGLLLFLVFFFLIILVWLGTCVLVVRYDEWRDRRRNRHH